MNLQINKRSENPGIVPPWLTEPARKQGVGRNPGIVPPWLTDDARVLPISPNAATTTAFVRTPVSTSPPSLADVLAAR